MIDVQAGVTERRERVPKPPLSPAGAIPVDGAPGRTSRPVAFVGWATFNDYLLAANDALGTCNWGTDGRSVE